MIKHWCLIQEVPLPIVSSGIRLISLPSLGGQTNLRIPQGTVGQVMLDDRAYLVRWEYSYSSWTLFTCEIEMLLHVVSTAGEGSFGRHCYREEKWTCLKDLEDRQYFKTKFRIIQVMISVICFSGSQ